MFASIRRHMDSQEQELNEALIRSLRLLIQGIELHSFQGDEADYTRFREDLQRLQASWAEPPTPTDVLVTTGALLKSYEEYNRRAKVFFGVQTAELQTMVGMLTKTLASIASASERSVQRLQTIERQIQKASVIEDYLLLKVRLEECLGNLGDEIEHQKLAAVSASALQEQLVQRAPAGNVGDLETDKVTGLRTRAVAERKIEACLQAKRPTYAALFILDRLALMNARYGYAVGDEMLRFMVQNIGQGLSGDDALFRWAGPAVLAVLERARPAAEVRTEILRITAKKLTRNIETSGRSVMLPLAVTWALFPLAGEDSAQRLHQKLDTIVAKSTLGDQVAG